MLRIVPDEAVAVDADAAGGTPELDADDNEAHEPEHEEDQGAYYDDGGEQAALGDQPEEQDDVDDSEAGDGDVVGEVPAASEVSDPRLSRRRLNLFVHVLSPLPPSNTHTHAHTDLCPFIWRNKLSGGGWERGGASVPGHVEVQLLLHIDEGTENTNDEERGGEHDDHPDVELYGGPVVSMDAGDPPVVDVRVRPRPRHRGRGHSYFSSD